MTVPEEAVFARGLRSHSLDNCMRARLHAALPEFNVDLVFNLCRSRFSHTRVDWFDFGGSPHTGSGTAFLARNNYTN